MIATLKSQGLSNRAIGRQLGVNHQTINNELKRGTVRQIRRQKFNGKTYDYPYHIYSYEAGHNIYLKCHQRSEIGHWELDTIQGHKDGKDSVVLVMTDRFSRVNITRKITSKTAYAVNHFLLSCVRSLARMLTIAFLKQLLVIMVQNLVS